LYCPRPEGLSSRDAAILRHLRDSELSEDLFDGADGLELHAMLQENSARLDAGIIVSPIDAMPATLGETYKGLFNHLDSWSWLLTWWIAGRWPRSGNLAPVRELGSHGDLGFKLVAGDPQAVKDLQRSQGLPDRSFRILPAHTLTITATVGGDR